MTYVSADVETEEEQEILRAALLKKYTYRDGLLYYNFGKRAGTVAGSASYKNSNRKPVVPIFGILPNKASIPRARAIYLMTIGPIPKGMHVMHKNLMDPRETPDNLVLVTRSEQRQRCPIPANNRSGYKGVSWYSKQKSWLASFTVDKITHRRYGFHSAEAAAMYYSFLVRRYGAAVAETADTEAISREMQAFWEKSKALKIEPPAGLAIPVIKQKHTAPKAIMEPSKKSHSIAASKEVWELEKRISHTTVLTDYAMVVIAKALVALYNRFGESVPEELNNLIGD